ncbi:GIY-YIG nuclease family protein [bacterium]|nr:GIY-YIG nuclease family protein [bacterium]
MDKTHILNEIRRLAVENGDAPVGRERFERETGIRESDWSGKYWIRWNDAVREAGYEPNQLNAAHDEEFMLSAYIGLVRELGKVPVQAELEMKRRNDANFPSSKTFRRFGGKNGLISHAAGYCEQNQLHDVLDLLRPALELATRTTPDEPEEIEPSLGYVYLLQAGKYFKIGRTNSLGRREYEIGLQLPERAKTVHVIETDDPVGIESYWHRRFAECRKNGEWFELKSTDVKAFKRRKYM